MSKIVVAGGGFIGLCAVVGVVGAGAKAAGGGGQKARSAPVAQAARAKRPEVTGADLVQAVRSGLEPVLAATRVEAHVIGKLDSLEFVVTIDGNGYGVGATTGNMLAVATVKQAIAALKATGRDARDESLMVYATVEKSDGETATGRPATKVVATANYIPALDEIALAQ